MLDTQVRWLPVEQIAPNPHQPRREFAPGPLAELAESIRRHGIIQPLTVRHSADGWELIAGERRLRAAKLAGLQTVPCLEMQVDEQDSAILALIENIQRRDLHYLEEAAAIAAYLRQFRGMAVDAEQIIIGAGTEQLYSMLVQLLGRGKRYAAEDPGYSKIVRIYRSNQAEVVSIPLDSAGLSVTALERAHADVVHISPSHHYPTGIVMPIARRQELLHWAEQGTDRYILEDDYDSEFRFVGRPIPTLFSVDEGGRVVYLNTFSKTIAPSIRISYMVLPQRLLPAFREKLGFYSSTVSGFEQYTLARFMAEGYYEKHLNRMRKRYHQKRDAVIACIRGGPLAPRARITEEDAGLHFLMTLDTSLSDTALRRMAEQRGLRLAMLSEYYSDHDAAPPHVLVVNYSGVELEKLPRALARLAEILEEHDHE